MRSKFSASDQETLSEIRSKYFAQLGSKGTEDTVSGAALLIDDLDTYSTADGGLTSRAWSEKFQ